MDSLTEDMLCAAQTTILELKREIRRLNDCSANCPIFHDSATALQHQTAARCLELIHAADGATTNYEDTFYMAVESIKLEFGL